MFGLAWNYLSTGAWQTLVSSLYPYLQFLHPELGSLEGVGVGDIVDHDGGLGAPVVHGRQGVISLLARRVPDLELDCRVVQADCLGQKCSSNGGLENNRLDSPSSGVPSLPPCLPLEIHEIVPSQTAELTKTFLLLIHLK